MARISKAPDIRRQELIDIGFRLYMKNGMAGLSIKDIVEQAGVATGLFYYYFKSKEIFVDEALNNFIIKNMGTIQGILSSDNLTISQKAQNALNTFWTYSEQIAPYKSAEAFQTEQHYALTNKLLEQMQPVLQKVVEDGVNAGVFHSENPPLTAGYILYGLSSILNTQINISSKTKNEMSRLVFTTLGVDATDMKGMEI